MSRIAALLCLLAIALTSTFYAPPAHAQRVFVSGTGSDSNPCTFAAPCRTFQQAFNIAAASGEIDVLDPAAYGPLTITHAISIEGHGYAGISEDASNGSAITISAGATDAVTLNGLLLDGAGSGQYGIAVTSGGSVQILNCVVRHFQYGISNTTSTNPANFLVQDTVISDNSEYGISFVPGVGVTVTATLSRIKANDNQWGVGVNGATHLMIENSVMSNNKTAGLQTFDSSAIAWLARTAISGNGFGVDLTGGIVNSYGDNDINGNMTDLSGTLTSASAQ